MSSYSLTRQAYCDLEEAEEFLRPRNPEAARKFILRTVEVFEMLAVHPELGRRRSNIRVGLRSFSLGTHLAYGEVQILRVLHGARDAVALLSVVQELSEE